MSIRSYAWLEMGTGLQTTNLQTITSATDTVAIAAPANGAGIIIYQIDVDVIGDSVVIGDNNAVDGTDRIAFKTLNTGFKSVTFPTGWFARANNQINIKTAGATVKTWVRIQYALTK